MSTYTQLEPYLRPEYKFEASEGSSGWTWQYRYPFKNTDGSSTGLAKPAIGDLWIDGLPLTSVSETASLDNSRINELTVSTTYSVTGGGPTETTLEEEKYSIRPSVSQVELAQHPMFLPGATGTGACPLYGSGTVAGGTAPNNLTETALGWVMLWENEPNPLAKAHRKVYKRDSDGKAVYPDDGDLSNAIAIPSTGVGAYATAFIKLRQLNFSTKDVYNPIAQKISIYRGVNAPIGDTWGQYVAAASVPGIPSGLAATYPHWIKTGDAVEQIGSSARWQRTEEWTGYTAVYFDVDTINPASLTLP